MLGDTVDTGVIDFDFLGERENGSDVIRALRQKNQRARITLATARTGDDGAFGDARRLALGAGANEALSTLRDGFEASLRSFLVE